MRMPCKGANQHLMGGTMGLRCMNTLKTAAECPCTAAGGPYLSPGYRFGPPNNDLAQSRRRESSAPQVIDYQWDALKP